MNIKVDNKKAINLFTAISKRAANPIEANKIIANFMRKDVLDHFKQESDENGRWKDLKPETWIKKIYGSNKSLSGKGSGGGHTKMLQNSGTLRNRNIPFSSRTAAGIYNDVSYAVYHQEGTKNIPQRKFLWLSDSALTKILNYMAKYIVRNNLMGELT